MPSPRCSPPLRDYHDSLDKFHDTLMEIPNPDRIKQLKQSHFHYSEEMSRNCKDDHFSSARHSVHHTIVDKQRTLQTNNLLLNRRASCGDIPQSIAAQLRQRSETTNAAQHSSNESLNVIDLMIKLRRRDESDDTASKSSTTFSSNNNSGSQSRRSSFTFGSSDGPCSPLAHPISQYPTHISQQRRSSMPIL